MAKKGVAITIAAMRPGSPPPLKRLDEVDKPDAEPDPEDPNEPDEDEEEGGVKPEWVAYHDDQEVCGTCEYMNGDQCSVLKMPVPQYGHCEAWDAKDENQEQPSGEQPPEQQPDYQQ